MNHTLRCMQKLISVCPVYSPVPTLAVSSIPQGQVEEGSSVTLTCNATLFSPSNSVQLMWGKPQVINTDTDSRYKISETSSGLNYSINITISDVRSEDEGEYVCTLLGSGSDMNYNKSISLSVGKWPQHLDRQNIKNNSLSQTTGTKSSGVIVQNMSGLSVIVITIVSILTFV